MTYKKDLILGSGFLVISIILFIFSFGLKAMANISIGPEFFPRLISLLTAICSLVLLYEAFLDYKKYKELDKSDIKEIGIKFNLEVVKIFLLMLMYAILLKKIGYLIMTAVYLFLHFLLVSDKKSRKVPVFIIISIVVSVGTYYAFRNIFGVILPAGILG